MSIALALIAGNALKSAASDELRHLKQLALVLLLDKSALRGTELESIAPALSAAQLGHLLRAYSTQPGNPDAVNLSLLRALPVSLLVDVCCNCLPTG